MFSLYTAFSRCIIFCSFAGLFFIGRSFKNISQVGIPAFAVSDKGCSKINRNEKRSPFFTLPHMHLLVNPCRIEAVRVSAENNMPQCHGRSPAHDRDAVMQKSVNQGTADFQNTICDAEISAVYQGQKDKRNTDAGIGESPYIQKNTAHYPHQQRYSGPCGPIRKKNQTAFLRSMCSLFWQKGFFRKMCEVFSSYARLFQIIQSFYA